MFFEIGFVPLDVGGVRAGRGVGRIAVGQQDVAAAAHRADEQRRALERQFQRVHPALAGALRRHTEDQVQRQTTITKKLDELILSQAENQVKSELN